MKPRNLLALIPPAAFGCFVLALWHGAVTTFDIPVYVLPAPADVAEKLITHRALIGRNTAITAAEALTGFAIATVAAFVTAVALAYSRLLRACVFPYVIALKTVPLVAMVPLLVLWLGNGLASKATMAALISYFPIVVNLMRGMLSIPPEWLDLFSSLSASRWKVFVKLRLPSSMPYLFAALKVSATLSVIGALVAEMAGSDVGIGYMILAASYRVETDTVFACILVASLLGITFYYALDVIERAVIYWQDVEESFS